MPKAKKKTTSRTKKRATSARKPAKRSKKTSRSKKKSQEVLIVSSKVRAFIKNNDCMTSSELIPALNEVVYETLQKACDRAQANKRSTLRARDL